MRLTFFLMREKMSLLEKVLLSYIFMQKLFFLWLLWYRGSTFIIKDQD